MSDTQRQFDLPEELVTALILSGMLLLAALADLPYGYYGFLRLCVTAASVWLALTNLHRKRRLVALFLFAIALLFNPAFPPKFEVEEWQVIDLALAIAFAGYAALLVPPYIVRRALVGIAAAAGLGSIIAVFAVQGDDNVRTDNTIVVSIDAPDPFFNYDAAIGRMAEKRDAAASYEESSQDAK